MLLRTKYILFLLACCGMWACTHKVPEETLQVVAQADSLWHIGKIRRVDEGDSAILAQAYADLGENPRAHADEYAHACYHYGRLLRTKDNPVEAMQCFINATHSDTRDYHILGRVYSNMGSICHLAGEFSLSYDMYEKSANMFLQNGDTLLYYYGLNNMAYELAEQGKKEETQTLLSIINEYCKKEEVLTKALETQARLHLKCAQYDTALYYAYMVHYRDTNNSAATLLIAQSYSYLNRKDSASAYARKVLLNPHDLNETSNALYILTNDDETRDKHSIRAAAADRADAQKLIEIRQGKLSRAVQLLELDKVPIRDKRWIWTLVASVLFVLVALFLIYLFRKRKQHQRIIRDIQAKKQVNAQLTNTINELTHMQEEHRNEIITDIEKSCQLFRDNQVFNDRLHWKDYGMMCESANRYLYNIATHLQPYNLSEKEVRLCILVLLKASTEKMVDLIPYAQSGIGKFKYTTARKLGTTTANMRTFILDLLG